MFVYGRYLIFKKEGLLTKFVAGIVKSVEYQNEILSTFIDIR